MGGGLVTSVIRAPRPMIQKKEARQRGGLSGLLNKSGRGGT